MARGEARPRNRRKKKGQFNAPQAEGAALDGSSSENPPSLETPMVGTTNEPATDNEVIIRDQSLQIPQQDEDTASDLFSTAASIRTVSDDSTETTAAERENDALSAAFPGLGNDGEHLDSVNEKDNEFFCDKQSAIWDFGHPIYSRFRAQRFVQFRHSIVFFSFAIFGVFTLIFVKSLDVQIGHLIYFSVVLGFMAAYFFLNLSYISGLRLRYDYLGDNLYYLGFVYTLGTLAYTLYKFDPADVYGVVSSFGIALSSTVLGVVLRIVAHQLHVDPREIEDAVRADLADLTSRLRGALDIVVRDMTIFGDETRQVIGELRNDVANEITGSVDRLVTASNRLLNSVDASFEAFAENVVTIRGLSNNTTDALKALIAKIEAVEAPSNIIEQKLVPATNQIAVIVTSMAEVSQQVRKNADALKDVTETMSTTVIAVREQLDVVSGAASHEEVARRVSLAANALKEMSDFVTILRDHMKNLVNAETAAVAELRGEYQKSVATIKEQSDAIKKELDRFRSMTAETQDALINLAIAIKNSV